MDSSLTFLRSNSGMLRWPKPSPKKCQKPPSPDTTSRVSENKDTSLTPDSTPRTCPTPDSSPYSTMGLQLTAPSRRRGSAELAPVSPLACVFTDIVGSTPLWEFNESGMEEALRKHNDLIRSYIDTFHGYAVNTTGDGFLLVFKDAVSALKFCLNVQVMNCRLNWPEAILAYHSKARTDGTAYQCLALRIGCHFGMPAVESTNPLSHRKDYYGPLVNRTSRIMSKAFGGQIALSDDFITEISKGAVDIEEEMTNATREIILNRKIPTDFTNLCHVKSLGSVELKGVKDEMHITLICCPTRPAEIPEPPPSVTLSQV